MKMTCLKLLLLIGPIALAVPSGRAQTEPELIALLQSGASAVEKGNACQKLRLVGTAKAVPALSGLLMDERISQAARLALEGLPGPEASAALRDALGTTSGLLKAGVADSLGWKRDAAAVSLLQPLLSDPDTPVGSSAAAALGRIGGKDALAALKAALESAAPAVRPVVTDALLACAEKLLVDGEAANAEAIYRSLAKASEPEPLRIAAHAGLIRCSGKGALVQIKSALQGEDLATQAAALQLVGAIQDPEATKVLSELLPKSHPALQVALLGVLQTRGDAAALPAVLVAARSPDATLRTAALAAVGDLGDASTVSFLAEAAAATDAGEQKVVRQALASLRRGDVAGALVAQFGSASPAVQIEVIRALTARDEKSAVPALLQLARGDQPATRNGALQALSQLAEGDQVADLVELLSSARDAAARDEIVSVFDSLSERSGSGKGLDFEPILRGLASGSVETRKALLQVCAFFVNESLRNALRSGLKDSDEGVRVAAARALCGARDISLLPDLLTVARENPDAGLRSLAIKSSVRLATEEGAGLSTEQRAGTLLAAYELAKSVEDKRQVLSGLARVPSQMTLEAARKASADPAVQAEAKAAMGQLAQKLNLFTGPFIQEWLVCGPFRQAGAAGALAVFDIPFGPEKPGEKPQWHAVPRAEQVNLASLFPGQENCAAYLKAEVVAPEVTDALLLLGSDDGVKVWLNGKVVHANNVDRGDVADQDKATIRLAKGSNELLLKITQGGGGWSCRARILGMDGQPIVGLQIAPQTGAPPVTVQAPKPPPTPKAATLPPRDNFKKVRLFDQFYAEGAYFGDFNHDGKLDIVAGPFWFEGPDFHHRHEYRPVKAYDPKEYSDNFLTYTGDCNADGWTDIVCVPFPGKEGYWFENPAGKEAAWNQHLYYPIVGNESPVWGDITADGRPELVFCNEGYLGYAGPDLKQPDQPWIFNAVSQKDARYQRFTHGVGFGDINGDGVVDIVEAAGWWEQPASAKPEQPWLFHPFHFADAGAQMLVYDVSGDGLSDIITSWNCHEYGLIWWQQIRKDGAAPGWEQHMILPPKPDVETTDLRVSQLHAFALADMNGDGVKDIVTGKRYWAHGPSGDPESSAPAILLWFEIRREAGGKVSFVPHLIDDDSGVGTQVATADLNGDDRFDVIVANKKGIFLHLSQGSSSPGRAAARL